MNCCNEDVCRSQCAWKLLYGHDALRRMPEAQYQLPNFWHGFGAVKHYGEFRCGANFSSGLVVEQSSLAENSDPELQWLQSLSSVAWASRRTGI